MDPWLLIYIDSDTFTCCLLHWCTLLFAYIFAKNELFFCHNEFFSEGFFKIFASLSPLDHFFFRMTHLSCEMKTEEDMPENGVKNIPIPAEITHTSNDLAHSSEPTTKRKRGRPPKLKTEHSAVCPTVEEPAGKRCKGSTELVDQQKKEENSVPSRPRGRPKKSQSVWKTVRARTPNRARGV